MAEGPFFTTKIKKVKENKTSIKKDSFTLGKSNAKAFPNLTAAIAGFNKRMRGSPTDSLEELPPQKAQFKDTNTEAEMEEEDSISEVEQTEKTMKHGKSKLTEEVKNKLARTVYLQGKDTNVVKAFATHKAKDFKKEITKKFGEVEGIEIVKDSIRVICLSTKQRDKLLQFNELWNCKFTATIPHFFANKTETENQKTERKIWKKVVIHKAPVDMETEYIRQETESIWAHRITKKINGEIKLTPTVILAYEEAPPERVFVGLYTFKTEPFIPTPIRCNKCQKFGHKTKNCRNDHKTCARCAGAHEIESCPAQKADAKCANCGGPHSSAYKGCQKYKTTATALKYTVQEGISYKAALQKSNAETKPTNKPIIEEKKTCACKKENETTNNATVALITATAEAVQWLLKQTKSSADQTAILSALATALESIKQLQHTNPDSELNTQQDPQEVDLTTEPQTSTTNGS